MQCWWALLVGLDWVDFLGGLLCSYGGLGGPVGLKHVDIYIDLGGLGWACGPGGPGWAFTLTHCKITFGFTLFEIGEDRRFEMAFVNRIL